ncbi:hypothetical protein [Nocardia cyriacigeorgica]|uniref:Mce-associated membrane protein n=1 Tax=Nocardia cyriacigeorgica TaxID=135487 RepID=A0A5R8NX75_9NOCA|nr:hypothetical protein [Nocardia cyriacigeorgica]TLF80766.1 hypothetical protein FEK34_03425 [Nocardia cyriacigeorgica]
MSHEPENSTAATTAEQQTSPSPRSISFTVTAVVRAAVAAVLVVALVVVSWLLVMARSDIADRDAAAAAERRAEQVATDYAVGSATVDFSDINAWVARLKANTSPELAAKFEATAPELERILVPLQWKSTAGPIATTVESESGGVYKVLVFVDVNSTNSQDPAGARTTVTYAVTVDANNGWHVTDVGSTGSALPVK